MYASHLYLSVVCNNKASFEFHGGEKSAYFFIELNDCCLYEICRIQRCQICALHIWYQCHCYRCLFVPLHLGICWICTHIFANRRISCIFFIIIILTSVFNWRTHSYNSPVLLPLLLSLGMSPFFAYAIYIRYERDYFSKFMTKEALMNVKAGITTVTIEWWERTSRIEWIPNELNRMGVYVREDTIRGCVHYAIWCLVWHFFCKVSAWRIA